MTSADGGVDVDELTVRFGDVEALTDVSLSIDDGEFFTLVGPSGCGKTTLLRTVAGLEAPTAGRVRIDGRDATDEPPEERGVGVVFQNYALFPHMTARENVAYGLQFHDLPEPDDQRVTELLDLVDLTSVADREPDQLSGGQKQRIALARALAPKPDVLLLDEPLSALDASLRKRLRVQIRSIQRDLDITTVYVTHDQAEALAISDRVAVVRDGRIEQVGTPEGVYREPATRFVAEFVGDNNVFDGVVTGTGDRISVDGTATLPLPAETDLSTGASVTVSVRPEAISVQDRDGAQADGHGSTVDERGPGAAVTRSATVETVEYLGDAYRVHCRWDDRPITVKTDSASPPEGAVSLGFAPDAIHVLSNGDRPAATGGER
ncbi:ABC transporter ATP-binding protein [Halorientalis pallida]|uniref:Molybdate/tungstate import ATP-binding protein WtpC n=1 Tax=Halorientalis pallida TaxID=2479928 RepID=A0A498KVY5_9EURY|nr:ABC transporter ATP-binding protein [Halorientalis pallida]RXK49408.1 ABC transporter ATP-binding protein [Halorientalis pallida]